MDINMDIGLGIDTNIDIGIAMNIDIEADIDTHGDRHINPQFFLPSIYLSIALFWTRDKSWSSVNLSPKIQMAFKDIFLVFCVWNDRSVTSQQFFFLKYVFFSYFVKCFFAFEIVREHLTSKYRGKRESWERKKSHKSIVRCGYCHAW